jgi:hypothetical protein
MGVSDGLTIRNVARLGCWGPNPPELSKSLMQEVFSMLGGGGAQTLLNVGKRGIGCGAASLWRST